MDWELENWTELLVPNLKLFALPITTLFSAALCLWRLAIVEVMKRGKELEMIVLLGALDFLGVIMTSFRSSSGAISFVSGVSIHG